MAAVRYLEKIEKLLHLSNHLIHSDNNIEKCRNLQDRTKNTGNTGHARSPAIS